MDINIGDRVRYIHEEERNDLGWFPPFGTLGTIIKIDDDGPLVRWDHGTKGDGEWWCYFSDVEKVYHYRVEVLIGDVRFSHNCNTAKMALDALNGIFNAMPNTKRDVDFKNILDEMESGKRISYNECPICICRVSGEA